jgi:hypothetical protein
MANPTADSCILFEYINITVPDDDDDDQYGQCRMMRGWLCLKVSLDLVIGMVATNRWCQRMIDKDQE